MAEQQNSITQFLAIYAALLSSIGFGWNLYRDLCERPKLKVRALLRMMATSTDGRQYAVLPDLPVKKDSQRIFVEINAVNLRKRPVHIEYCAGKYREPVEGHSHLAMIPIRLPITLQEGESVSEFYDDPSLVNDNVISLCLVDSTQKAWKVSRRNLKRR
jgi:hypothetical protein